MEEISREVNAEKMQGRTQCNVLVSSLIQRAFKYHIVNDFFWRMSALHSDEGACRILQEVLSKRKKFSVSDFFKMQKYSCCN
jgi:hypothetical protein